MKKLLLSFICGICLMQGAHAYDTFHPEADETLASGKAWVETSFKEGDTMATNVFRAWIPYESKDVWSVLIDTNIYKDIHGDYTDSRTLDENQFRLVEEKKPETVKGFYELIGQQTFSSEHGRLKGRVWTSYVFQRFNLPWPLADRWNVMKVKNDESGSAKGEYRYEYKTVTGNFKELKGYWALVPLPDKPGWTEFRGEYKADPGIAVPHFMAKSIFKASMRKSVKENMDVLAKRGAKKTL